MDDMDMAWTMDDMDRLVPRATIPSIPSIVHSRPCAAGMSMPSIPGAGDRGADATWTTALNP